MKKKLLPCLLALLLIVLLCACTRAGKLPPRYDVHFELNGGSLVSGELLQSVSSGEDAVPPVVEREGYVFRGWSGTYQDVRADSDVLAQWTKLFQIRFDPDGGTVVSGQATQQLEPGETPTAPEVSREGAEFLGWEPEIGPATADCRYTARWELKDRTFTSEEVYAYIAPSVLEIQVSDSSGEPFAVGSGFFIDEKGLAVTNYHVMEGAYSAKATLYDGSEAEIDYVVDYNESLDLALVHVAVSGNSCLSLSERGVTTGETVYAMGSSLGLTGTFSDGLVSRASRRVEGIDCIQTTAPISHGNSGGPLVNVHGEVVGVNSMTLADGQNLNFAINIRELENLDRSGEMKLSAFGHLTGGAQPGGETTQTGGYYDEFELHEMESNDSASLADSLAQDDWTAADLSDYYDYDIFYFGPDCSGTLRVELAPYWIAQEDLFECELLVARNDELVEEIPLTSEDGVSYTARFAEWTAEPDCVFFLLVTAAETAAEDTEYPLYYAVRYRFSD